MCLQFVVNLPDFLRILYVCFKKSLFCVFKYFKYIKIGRHLARGLSSQKTRYGQDQLQSINLGDRYISKIHTFSNFQTLKRKYDSYDVLPNASHRVWVSFP
jgi:hypothetical protein